MPACPDTSTKLTHMCYQACTDVTIRRPAWRVSVEARDLPIRRARGQGDSLLPLSQCLFCNVHGGETK